MKRHKDIQRFAFQVLRECSSWACRIVTVQMRLQHQPETCFLEICKVSKVSGCVARVSFLNVKCLEVRKMSEVFLSETLKSDSHLPKKLCYLLD